MSFINPGAEDDPKLTIRSTNAPAAGDLDKSMAETLNSFKDKGVKSYMTNDIDIRGMLKEYRKELNGKFPDPKKRSTNTEIEESPVKGGK